MAPNTLQAAIPAAFWHVPYDAAHHPGADTSLDLADGANCQVFAYALLRHFGREIPNFRSSDLWDDRDHTSIAAAPFEPLDLLLFNHTPDAYGAHVALYLGNDRAIHLSQRIGKPVIWPMARFLAEDSYRVLVGAKRVLLPGK